MINGKADVPVAIWSSSSDQEVFGADYTCTDTSKYIH
jgi:hypothetical protein